MPEPTEHKPLTSRRRGQPNMPDQKAKAGTACPFCGRMAAVLTAYRKAMLSYNDKYGSFLPLREKALEMDEELRGDYEERS